MSAEAVGAQMPTQVTLDDLAVMVTADTGLSLLADIALHADGQPRSFVLDNSSLAVVAEARAAEARSSCLGRAVGRGESCRAASTPRRV